MAKRSKQRGIASIEFALGFLLFWLMCTVWVEMSYMSFISAINDVAIAEASRSAKISDGDYKQVFENALKKEGSIWQHIASSDKFRVTVQYLNDIGQLATMGAGCEVPEGESSAECGQAHESAIAIYHSDYDYQPIFNILLNERSVFSREVIVVQEYERSEFEV